MQTKVADLVHLSTAMEQFIQVVQTWYNQEYIDGNMQEWWNGLELDPDNCNVYPIAIRKSVGMVATAAPYFVVMRILNYEDSELWDEYMYITEAEMMSIYKIYMETRDAGT